MHHSKWRTFGMTALAAAALVVAACNVPDPSADQVYDDTDVAQTLTPSATVTYYGQQQLQVYRPSDTGPRPVIVWIHGGGWTGHGAIDQPDRPNYAIIEKQLARGYAIVSISYRVTNIDAPSPPSNAFPIPLYDVKAAIRWVKARAATYSFDPAKVFVAGASAGGHLAALAAVTPGQFTPPNLPAALQSQSDAVIGVVDVVGPSDLKALDTAAPLFDFDIQDAVSRLLACRFTTYQTPAGKDAVNAWPACTTTQLDAASPIHYLTAGASPPPAYLVYGGTDGSIPPATQGQPLHDAWLASKGTGDAAYYDLVENGTHFIGGVFNGNVGHINKTVFEYWLDRARDGGF